MMQPARQRKSSGNNGPAATFRKDRVKAARNASTPAAASLSYFQQNHPDTAPGVAVQAKLKVGKANDQYEQEADQVADRVMTMPDTTLSRQAAEEEEEVVQPKPLATKITAVAQRQAEEEEAVQTQPEEEETVQAKQDSVATAQVSDHVESSIKTIKGSGKPLRSAERAFFEPRFGRDFGAVRIHTEPQAAQTARSINARAYTLGSNVVFGAGQYSPESSSGRRLLAHELTHVVQQGKAPQASVKHLQNNKNQLRSTPQVVQRDRADVLRLSPGQVLKVLTDIRSHADDLKDVLGQEEASGDLYQELTNPKKGNAERWSELLIKHWTKRLSRNKNELLYAGSGAIVAYSKLIKKRDPVVGLMDKSEDYKRWAGNNLRESKRSGKLKLKYRKAYKIVGKIQRGMLILYGIMKDMKYIIQVAKLGRLHRNYWVLYKIHRERARVLARIARIQTNIARIFNKASIRYDRKLSPGSKQPTSGTHTPTVLDLILGISRKL